jgi:biotin carboxyl carrier protein
MPGTVIQMDIAPGQHVTVHQPLMVIEAMKMEHVIYAPYAGTVERMLYQVGDPVQAGATLVELIPE